MRKHKRNGLKYRKKAIALSAIDLAQTSGGLKSLEVDKSSLDRFEGFDVWSGEKVSLTEHFNRLEPARFIGAGGEESLPAEWVRLIQAKEGEMAWEPLTEYHRDPIAAYNHLPNDEPGIREGVINSYIFERLREADGITQATGTIDEPLVIRAEGGVQFDSMLNISDKSK
jgi:hypothetical protein